VLLRGLDNLVPTRGGVMLMMGRPEATYYVASGIVVDRQVILNGLLTAYQFEREI
jgi:hypothetical protein